MKPVGSPGVWPTLAAGKPEPMMIVPQSPLELDEPDRTGACAVCGAAVVGGDIDDTNGWRWFSNGQGGLLPLCPECPVPTDVVGAY